MSRMNLAFSCVALAAYTVLIARLVFKFAHRKMVEYMPTFFLSQSDRKYRDSFNSGNLHACDIVLEMALGTKDKARHDVLMQVWSELDCHGHRKPPSLTEPA